LNWLEISLTVDGELAEAISDVLSRHIQQNLATEIQIDDKTPQSSSAQVIVRGYLPIDGGESALKERIEKDLWHLRQIMDFPDPTYQLVPQQDWTEQWRQHYHPMPVGKRLMIVPAWYKPPKSSRQAIILEPGMAFGTGTHPTTQLCIQELENYIGKDDRVFDVGGGSGILSIASILLGAGEVIALDIDPTAVQSTLENAELNLVSDRIQVFSGSLEELFAGDPELYLPGAVVVANILTKTLVNLLNDGLERLLAPGAKLILSGVLFDQIDPILEATECLDLELLVTRADEDWRALVFKKKELPPRRGSSGLPEKSGG
jgi:ribosomal protein L11 methyltransferase